ncbi:MAG TPA: TonB-dependent receptor plug domain-containing protein [Lacibacter sp.]|nr:TonB-dependent receptor plug domain-containing protein [Lacibacter sp.]
MAAQDHPQYLRIFNAVSGTPVENASVYHTLAGFGEVSDDAGMVSLRRLPAHIRHLTISAIGFAITEVRLDSLTYTNGKADIRLQPRIASLEDVVVKASARSGIFKTISDLDIHIRPIVNSQEVLRMVPGLFIGQHAGGGKAEQIFLRGFDIDHGTDINITVDGMPVNMVSHAHGQGYADLHFLIPELIDKVQFNKGPYDTEKGNFTTAGYVAFKTKKYLERNFIKAEAGQFNTFRGIAGLNLLRNNTADRSLLFASEFSATRGYFESPQNFTRFNGLLKYHTRAGNNHYFTATGSAFTSKWNASGQIPDRAVASGQIGFFGAIDDTEGGTTSRHNLSVELQSYLSNSATWKNQLFYSYYDFELYSNFTFFKEDPVFGDQIRQKEKRNILGFNSSYEQPGRLFNRDALFRAGLQVRYDAVNGLELSRTRNRTITTLPLTLGEVRESNWGVFAEEKINLGKQLDVQVGLRGDYFTNAYNDVLNSGRLRSSSPIISPKLNVNYKVNRQVQLYWYNGQGFHSNDTRVAVQQNGREVVTPAWGSDLGAIVKPGKKLLIQTALWYLWMKQEFIYVGDEGVVEPGGRTRRLGADLSVRYELCKYLFADVDLSWTNPVAVDEPKENRFIPLAPRFTSTGGLSYRKDLGWNGSLRYRYMANRPANEDNSVVARGYFVTDFALNYTQRSWEAGVAIQNLFNTRWKETQFDTESRLQNEPAPVSEIHFTPGTPFFARLSLVFFF